MDLPGGSTYSKNALSPATQRWRDVAVSLSLVNFIYLRVWAETVFYNTWYAFRMHLPPSPLLLTALMLNILVGGALIFLAVTTIRRYPTGFRCFLSYFGFMLGLVLAGNSLRSAMSRYWDFLRGQILRYIGLSGTYILCGVIVILIAIVMYYWMRQTVRLAYRLLLVTSPFVLVCLAQGAWAAFHYDPGPYLSHPAAAVLPVRPGAPRILWVVFDEFDERLGFDERPATLVLPELDKFRAGSLYATHAYPPDSATAVSLPSLIEGRKLVDYHRLSPHQLRVKFKDSPWQDWSGAGTVFEDARKMGLNTALVGWYLPYCRLLSDQLTRCWWCEMETQGNSTGATLPSMMLNQARSLFETSLLSVFGQSLVVQYKAKQFQEMLRETLADVVDPQIGFTFVHMDIPHSPFPYDRKTQTFTLRNSAVQGYLDNLALADRTLGQIRHGMEAAGLWDSTTVLITSDHFDRDAKLIDGKLDRRIPFMLKLPGQTEGAAHDAPVNSIVSRQLLLAIAGGQLTTTADVRQWLSARQSTEGSTLPIHKD